MHCLVFLMGLAFTLKHDGHVRVDIFYRDFSPKSKAMVNLIGGLLFLVPVCLVIFFTSRDYVLASWAIHETSVENNGLPFVYLLKTLMLLMPVTLLLQGIAEVITHHYTQNIDLRDAKTVLSNSGTAIMGSSTASGTNRANEAIMKALDSPLLNDNKISGAKNVLLLIVSGSQEITIDEIGEINDP